MFRDREGVDCKGNTWSSAYQSQVEGPGGGGAVDYSESSSCHKNGSFRKNYWGGGPTLEEGRCFFCKAGISLDLFAVLSFQHPLQLMV